jgi:imidazolonepropionase-like amidohydrolase
LTFDAGPDHASVRASLEREQGAGVLAARALHGAQRALRAGITTLRDCGGPGEVTLRVRDAIATGLAVGPRMLVCGMPITTTGGHLHYCGLRADSETDVRKAVRALAQSGVDAIKIVASGGQMTAGSSPLLPQYPAAMLASAAQEAHRLGRRVVAHALNAKSIRDCILAGIDTIDHANWHGPNGELDFDPQAGARLAASGATIGLTGSGIWRQLLETDAEVQQLRERLNPHRQLFDLGVRVVPHSDAGVRFTPIDTFWLSLRVMEVGIQVSTSEVLRAATLHAAGAIGLERELGSLEPGKRGDLLVVEGDPLADLSNLMAVRYVLRDGQLLVDRGRLAHPDLTRD